MSFFKELEDESIYILREVVAECERPVMLYSAGKDSSVMLHLAKKAFYPMKIPFPLLHVDTSFKFKEMYTFRDRIAKENNLNLIVYRNEKDIKAGTLPYPRNMQVCCSLLKTKALLDAIKESGFDAAIGGARREEEKSRAKERIFSFREENGTWDPKNQRPELWNLYNTKIKKGESIRVFPLSNWTELDIWQYILEENIEVVPLYLAKKRMVADYGNGQLLPICGTGNTGNNDCTYVKEIMCRFRTLGCYHCTGAIKSEATTVEEIIEELKKTTFSERITRAIDHDVEGSMEIKKREGYF